MSIVDDFTAAFNRQDVAALVACFTPTASYTDNFYGEHRGTDELTAMFSRMFREGRDYVWRNDAVVESQAGEQREPSGFRSALTNVARAWPVAGSLTMFAIALLMGRKAGGRRPSSIVRAGFALVSLGSST